MLFLDELGTAGTVPRTAMAGLPPDTWMTVFQGDPKTLELVMTLLQQELQEIYGAWWWQVVAVEALIMTSLSFLGLQDHTAIFLHWIINIIMQRGPEVAGPTGHLHCRGQEGSPMNVPRPSASSEGIPIISMGTSSRRLGSFLSFTLEI